MQCSRYSREQMRLRGSRRFSTASAYYAMKEGMHPDLMKTGGEHDNLV